ncbi:hypothetical protein M409DRAFT_64119 [Zasmidium cellare ATCC 36951]|uniref:Tyrosinase copper-binding domain-containing protein n=1 Tax=Zasmidium cellare ATCC 36951 TaxID=1080233 RepID=A0A6A6CTG2_ZASCE|nr:uncharacterized protein M409DRAFT_64119 [Zasmidium cellare ATCC 36951]KAF2170345.1 hypothetical protein M409DRAFT_64119 [Zasmidium cellare ATCC 36951]
MLSLFVAWWFLLAFTVALPPPGPFHQRQKSSHWTPASTNGTDALAQQALKNAQKYLQGPRNGTSSCRFDAAKKRVEWDALCDDEKRDYINAVRCLQTRPSISGELVPGARNRYDDFVGTHINQTLSIHSTGNFLTWHRYFVSTYETALREECGFKAPLPYVNWARYSNNVINAPLFDGSDTSISDNGAYVPGRPTIHFPSDNNPIVSLPPSQGGGCITSGPFKDYKVNLGPVALVGVDTTSPNPQKDGLGYNPRCIRRDLSVTAASGASDFNTTKLITHSSTIAAFQDEMQGPFGYGIPEIGVHAAGHYILSGDPGSDFYTSPGDPWFFLHHAQIDRVYWMWQMSVWEKIEERLSSIAGTVTFLNSPPSRNATVEDRIDLGVNDEFRGLRIKEALSTVAGPFCYVYE